MVLDLYWGIRLSLMNTLRGSIIGIETFGSLSLVKVQVGTNTMTSIVIDSAETTPYLHLNNAVKVLFKETEVVMGKGDITNISLQNRLAGTISKMALGDLLARIEMETDVGQITSIITRNAVESLGLQVGEEALAMIKTNEVMLAADD